MLYVSLAIYIFLTLKELSKRGVSGEEVLAWNFLSLTLFGLGLNKQLDLQTLLTDCLRWLIHSLSLEAHRYILKVLFVVCVALLLGGGIFLGCTKLRSLLMKHKIVWLGFGLTLVFVLVRVLSFFIFSDELNAFLIMWYFYSILELSALLVIGVGVVAAKQVLHVSPK